jgi:hypothetical protein
MPAGLSNGSRRAKGLRLFIAVLGTLVPLAPGLASGCGSSSSTAAPVPTTQIPSDATVPLVMVVTGGGGAPTSSSSSSSGANQNPFGDLPMPDSGSSSGGTSSSGSGSDDGSIDSALSDDSGDGSGGPALNACTDYVVTNCGASPCDLRTNVCCVTINLDTRCVRKPADCDPKMEASIHCLQSCECPVGQVCCGVANTILGVVTSECQSIPDGGLCNPHPMTNTQASEQLCGTDAECTAGQGCIKQTCEYGVTLQICGLQSQAPFDCMPAQ